MGVLLSSLSAASLSARAHPSASDPKDLIGRWDLTLDLKGQSAPSWMEVKLSGFKTLVGYYVSVAGSARPVSKIQFENGKFQFAIPPQWESGSNDLVVEGELVSETIKGFVTEPDGKRYSFKGVKAPLLKRSADPDWGKPLALFNGKNLKGWTAKGNNKWKVENGILKNTGAGANLISVQKFSDFTLHVEFRYPKGSNSGIYLRGRYEVQIEDSPKDAHPNSVLYSGVYGFLPATEIVTNGPDEWNSYDIKLIGRRVTVIANGKTVICDQEIPGITGGALDSNEGEAGPIYIQGDHGPIEFRSIVITPAVK